MSSERSRNGGIRIGNTFSRKYRSSRNCFSATICSKSRFVAAISRKIGRDYALPIFFRTLAQRWYPNWKYVQPKIQVFAELLFGHHLFQITIRRRYQPQNRKRLRSSDILPNARATVVSELEIRSAENTGLRGIAFRPPSVPNHDSSPLSAA